MSTTAVCTMCARARFSIDWRRCARAIGQFSLVESNLSAQSLCHATGHNINNYMRLCSVYFLYSIVNRRIVCDFSIKVQMANHKIINLSARQSIHIVLCQWFFVFLFCIYLLWLLTVHCDWSRRRGECSQNDLLVVIRRSLLNWTVLNRCLFIFIPATNNFVWIYC